MKTTKIFGLVCGIIVVGLLTGCAGVSESKPADKEQNVSSHSLSIAVRRGDFVGVKYHVEHHANVMETDSRGRTMLHLAVISGKFEIVQYLLEHGANVNSRDNDGKTPLHIAFALKKDWIAGLLIEHGADRKIQDAYGRTPGDMKKARIENNADWVILSDGKAGQPAGNKNKYPKAKRDKRKSKW